jgi:hypothetical protein
VEVVATLNLILLLELVVLVVYLRAHTMLDLQVAQVEIIVLAKDLEVAVALVDIPESVVQAEVIMPQVVMVQVAVVVVVAPLAVLVEVLAVV